MKKNKSLSLHESKITSDLFNGYENIDSLDLTGVDFIEPNAFQNLRNVTSFSIDSG